MQFFDARIGGAGTTTLSDLIHLTALLMFLLSFSATAYICHYVSEEDQCTAKALDRHVYLALSVGFALTNIVFFTIVL